MVFNHSQLAEMVAAALAARPDAVMVVVRAGYMLALRAGETYYSDDYIAWQA